MRRAFLTLIACASCLTAAPVPQVAPNELESPLPDGAVARFGTTRFRHGAKIVSLDASADGKYIASLSEDGCLCIWDAANGRRLKLLRVEPTAARTISFAPDGKRLVTNRTSEQAEVVEWQSEKWRPLAKTELPQWSRWSPDGKLIACLTANEEALKILDADSGSLVRAFKKVVAWGFSGDGKTGAMTSLEGDGKCRLIDVACGAVLKELELNTREPLPEIFHFDSKGRWLVGERPGWPFVLWKLADGKQVKNEKLYGPVVMLPGEPAVLQRRVVQLCRIELPALKVQDLGVECDHDGPMVLLSGGRRLVLNEGERRLRVVDLASGKDVIPLGGHWKEIQSVTFVNGGKFLVTSDRDGVRLWEAATARQFPAATEEVWSDRAVMAPSEKFMVLTHGRQVTIRNHLNFALRQYFFTGVEQKVMSKANRGVKSVAVAPGGNRIVFQSDDKAVAVADVETGKVSRQVGLPSEPLQVVFHPRGGSLAVHGSDGFLRCYEWPPAAENANLPEPLWQKRVQRSERGAVAWSPDGLLIAVFSAGKTVIVESLTGRQWRGLDREFGEGEIRALAFSPDGRLVAAAHGGPQGFVRLWDVMTGKSVATLKGHEGNVNCIAFSPDGRLLASGGSDTSVLIWNVPPVPAVKSEPVPLKQTWESLDSLDIAQAYAAVTLLMKGGEETLTLIRDGEKLADERRQRIRKLIRDLESDEFRVRRAARAGLDREADRALPFLQEALAKELSADLERQIKLILESFEERNIRLPDTGPYGDDLRTLRSVLALEHIGGKGAIEVLEKLAAGNKEGRVGREIAAALQRMKK